MFLSRYLKFGTCQTIKGDFGAAVSTEPAFDPSTISTLVGRWVKLESVERKHVSGLFASFGLPEDKSVFDWLPWKDPLNTEEDLWHLFEKSLKDRNFIVYAILADPRHQAEAADGEKLEVLGTIGYLDVNRQNRTIEVGAVLFGSALRQSLAGSEAQYLILRNVCESSDDSSGLPFRRVAWKCNHLNAASRRAAERMGFVYEGTLRNHMIFRGRTRDSDFLSITEDEWPTVKEAFEKWLADENFDKHGKQLRRLEDIRKELIH